MKKLSLFLTIILGVWVSGCTTVTTNPDGSSTTNQITLDPVRTAAAVKGLAATGAALAISKDPNCAAYLKAVAVLARTAASGTYDPVKLRSVIDTISVNELQTPEARAAIEAFFGIYTAYFGDVVSQKLDQNIWVKPVLLALADGLEAGTGTNYKMYVPQAALECQHKWVSNCNIPMCTYAHYHATVCEHCGKNRNSL